MRRIALLILAFAFAAPEAAAQGTPNRRPPRDTIRIAEPPAPAAENDSAVVETSDDEPAAGDSVPRPGPFSEDGGRGPFSVESSGQAAPRPARGEVVWLESVPTPRVAAADTAARRPPARDSARTGANRTTSSGTPRDTASTRRTNTGQAGTTRTGQTARRDTTASRTAQRDTATRRPNTTAAAGNRTGQGSTPANRAGARTHTVAAGETFFGIARRYGVTAAQLRALNPDVDWENVEIGDVLRLPANARDSRAGTSGQGSRTGSQPSGRTGTQPSRPATRTHTVQAGETLFGIARRYGVTRQAIIDANDLESDRVRTGQRLVIPPPD